MRHYQHVDGPLKSSMPSPTSPATPSAHPTMPHHTLSEHSDPALDAIPIHPSGSPLSLFSPSSLSFLIDSPLPRHPLCDSPSQDDHAQSNLPGPSAPFDAACPNGPPAALTDKGKGKEPPPTLPPLSLSPPGLGYNIDDWSSTPGPSSYRSTCPSVRTDFFSHSPPSSVESTIPPADAPPILIKVPSRTRSLSNLSVHSTTPSMSKIRIKLAASSKAPVNLARKLLSRNKAEVAGPAVTGPADDLADALGNDLVPVDVGNCLFPWQTKDTSRASSPWPGVDTQLASVAVPDVTTVWSPDNHRLDGSRGNRRSYSSPYPKSAFDVVSQVDFEDKFAPLSPHARDLFDDLPRELRLRVLSALILLHEADHERLKKSGKWSVLVASSSKSRWVGRNRAMRELVKLSRVGIVDLCPVSPVNQS